MAKFMVLYNSDASAREVLAKATPDQVKASMQEWIRWKEEAEKTVKFEWGLPLQPVERILSGGSTEKSTSQVSGHSMMEGEKDQIVGLLKGHPHLKREGSSIDLLEMIPMSEM